MKKLLGKILSLLILFIVFPMVFGSVKAASFSFDKSTVSTTNGGTFQISVTVNPGSDALNSVDSYVTFDNTLLKATAVAAGTLFPTVTHDESTAGRVYIAGLVNDSASPVTTSGTLATITFQGLKDGSGTLSFNCDSSKIVKNDINASNVMTCSQNGTSTATIGSGGSSGGSNNPAPTSPPSNPEQLPQTGTFDNVVKFVIPAMILLIVGGAFRLLL